MTPESEVLYVNATTVSTNAAAGTLNQVALLAAPGAGFRYRVFALMGNVRPGVAGNLTLQLRYTGGSGGTAAAISGDENGMAGISFYPQGIPTNENQPLYSADRSSIASQVYDIIVYYTLEAVG